MKSRPGAGLNDMPEIQQRAAQPYLAIRREVTDGVPQAVDSAFPDLFASLGERGVKPAGPPFIRLLEIDRAGEPLELEVAVPVAGTVSGNGRVQAGELPPGRYAVLLHVGPYRSETAADLDGARSELLNWMDQHGLRYSRETERGSAPACCADHFRIGPESQSDWSKWETLLTYLIVEDD